MIQMMQNQAAREGIQETHGRLNVQDRTTRGKKRGCRSYGGHPDSGGNMLTVTELANRSGATPHAVRYYTRIGLLLPERNPDNGYRLYAYREIGWLRFIHQAKRLGYTLNEIREIKHDLDQGKSCCPRVREILLRRIDENRRLLEGQIALQARMEQAREQWADIPDYVPHVDSICHLIESFAEIDCGHPDKKIS